LTRLTLGQSGQDNTVLDQSNGGRSADIQNYILENKYISSSRDRRTGTPRRHDATVDAPRKNQRNMGLFVPTRDMPAAAGWPVNKTPLIESRRQIRISEPVRLKQSIY
jgi:hypothetical protein